MGFQRTWSDENLLAAVPHNHSWRGVARTLGIGPSSSWRIIQRRAADLSLDTSHFRGKRAWSDEDLIGAITECSTWSQVAKRIGVKNERRNVDKMEQIAHSHGVSTSHLVALRNRPSPTPVQSPEPTFAQFGIESEFLAAAWFAARGFKVSMAGPGLPYDLLVDDGRQVQKIQVKSSTQKTSPSGTVDMRLSRLTATRSHANRQHVPYGEGEVDAFFGLTSAGHAFLVPAADVSGRMGLALGPDSPYFVGTLGLSGR